MKLRKREIEKMEGRQTEKRAKKEIEKGKRWPPPTKKNKNKKRIQLGVKKVGKKIGRLNCFPASNLSLFY